MPATETDSKQKISKYDIITDTHASTTRGIMDAIVVKSQDIFLISTKDGQIPLHPEHGYGLYYKDCRYLMGYLLKVGHLAPEALVAVEDLPVKAAFELTNSQIKLGDDKKDIPKQSLGISWERLLDSDQSCLYERFTIHNRSKQSLHVPLSYFFQACFEDVFHVRGQVPVQLGTQHPPEWDGENNTLFFSYSGADGYYRSLTIHFSSACNYLQDKQVVEVFLNLDAGEQTQLIISMFINESKSGQRKEPVVKKCTSGDFNQLVQNFADDYECWKKSLAEIESDNGLLNAVMQRSLKDINTLMSTLRGKTYVSAGTPWFATLAGRDAIWTSLQFLLYDSSVAESTARLLADFQGTRHNEQNEEQPGKILHEFRQDEFTRAGKLPYEPYYGCIDGTALFLILIGQHALWTGSLDLFQELEGHVQQALKWIDEYSDSNGDGFTDYGETGGELYNQAWKDSSAAIVNSAGEQACLPIATVEVQGYVYLAKKLMAKLYRHCKNESQARQLEDEAEQLKRSFNKAFWMEDKQFYALALYGNGKQADVVSSNPGQALWTGIIDEDNVKKVIDRLFADDMFTHWGIRTLSCKEKAYNPIGYHLGTIWPYDNSVIAAGLKKNGYDLETCDIFNALLAAVVHFPDFQLPEVFAGFDQNEFGKPVHYLVAAHPQAWSAGSIPMCLTAALGIQPDALENKLTIQKPVLPNFVTTLTINRLKIGSSEIDLKFTETETATKVEVLRKTGDIQIEIVER